MKYICDKEDELFNYLKINISNKSKNNIKSLLKNECILVNNNIVTKYNYIVKTGDIIEVNKSKKINSELDIIYEDDNIIVVNKPSKLLTISNKNEKDNTLYRMVSNYLKKEKKKVFVIHRLDYDTSGVIMFAKNKEVQELYQSKWNELAKIREYTAVVEGILIIKDILSHILNKLRLFLFILLKIRMVILQLLIMKELCIIISIQCLRFIFLLAEEIKLDAICMILSILY